MGPSRRHQCSAHGPAVTGVDPQDIAAGRVPQTQVPIERPGDRPRPTVQPHRPTNRIGMIAENDHGLVLGAVIDQRVVPEGPQQDWAGGRCGAHAATVVADALLEAMQGPKLLEIPKHHLTFGRDRCGNALVVSHEQLADLSAAVELRGRRARYVP